MIPCKQCQHPNEFSALGQLVHLIKSESLSGHVSDDGVMILSARDLKVRGVLCALLFVRVVDLSVSHGGHGECGMPTAPGSNQSLTAL